MRKSTRMRLAGHIASERDETAQRFWFQSLKGRDQLEDQRVGRTILKWNLSKQMGMVWSGFFWLRIGTGGGIL
jgi:hypothetical protein